MKHSLILFAIFLSIASCKKDPPHCITSDTSDFKKYCCGNGASVKEYEFQGDKVYAFDPGICGADQTTEIKNEKCKTLGYLGGIMGNTKINGEEFSNAKFKKTVWSN